MSSLSVVFIIEYMPSYCCVPLCKERGGHAWPFLDPKRAKLWLSAVRREESWRPTKHSLVCKQHFDKNDYESVTTYGMYIKLSVAICTIYIVHVR